MADMRKGRAYRVVMLLPLLVVLLLAIALGHCLTGCVDLVELITGRTWEETLNEGSNE